MSHIEMFTRSFVGIKQDDFLSVCAMITQNYDFHLFEVWGYNKNTLVLTWAHQYTDKPSPEREEELLTGIRRDLLILNPFIREVVVDWPLTLEKFCMIPSCDSD